MERPAAPAPPPAQPAPVGGPEVIDVETDEEVNRDVQEVLDEAFDFEGFTASSHQ